jgi:hypothetical protein
VSAGASLDIWQRDSSLAAADIRTPDLPAHGVVGILVVMSHTDWNII